MSALLAALISGGTIGALVHWHDRRTTTAADITHYNYVRAEAAPVREIVEELDHWRRLCRRYERENARLRGVAAAWQARVGRLLARRSLPADPCPFPRFNLWSGWRR